MHLNNNQLNGLHILVPFMISDSASGETWTNMPAALTEFQGSTNRRAYFDFTGFDLCRLQITLVTAGAAGSLLKAQYSTDNGASWNDLTGTQLITTAGVLRSAWQNIPANAKQEVILRVVGQNGNGVTDPQFGRISIDIK